MSDLKYLYYSIKERQLLVLYLEDEEFDLYYVRFPFRFESKTFLIQLDLFFLRKL